MIDLYTWSASNGHKISIMLEETQLPYHVHRVGLPKNEQFNPEFLQIKRATRCSTRLVNSKNPNFFTKVNSHYE
jgi:GST-like protein